MITVSQEEYIRMLNLLKYQANFILKNSNVDNISETKEEAVDFLVMLNDLQLTFDEYLKAKDKYTLSEETKKCIEEAESLKNYARVPKGSHGSIAIASFSNTNNSSFVSKDLLINI